jgi:Na+/proline symporter
VSDVPIEPAIVCCGVVAGLYTVWGGIRAVVWTDVLQGALFIVAGGVLLATVAAETSGGLPAVLEWAGEQRRIRVFHLDPMFSLLDGDAFGVAVIGAFFLTLATHATDHDMVQRLLTTRDGRRAGAALFGSALLNFPLTLVFLLIGTGLAHFYGVDPGYPIEDHARIVPLFALHELPTGLRGLVFVGLFAAAMSSLDSAICAIATTWVNDVRPDPRAGADPARRMRICSLVLTGILIGAAIAMAAYHRAIQTTAEGGLSLVDFALSSMTVLYGALLGIFALGLLTRGRGSPRSVIFGAGVGACSGLLLFLHPLWLGEARVAWHWWIPISATLTFGTAALGATRRRERDEAFKAF